MTGKVSFHRLAERELNDAALFYEDRCRGLGNAFLDAVEQTVKAVQSHPRASSLVTEGLHRKRVPRFPYAIVFSIREDGIRVLAIAHQMRRPLYWQGRS